MDFQSGSECHAQTAVDPSPPCHLSSAGFGGDFFLGRFGASTFKPSTIQCLPCLVALSDLFCQPPSIANGCWSEDHRIRPRQDERDVHNSEAHSPSRGPSAYSTGRSCEPHRQLESPWLKSLPKKKGVPHPRLRTCWHVSSIRNRKQGKSISMPASDIYNIMYAGCTIITNKGHSLVCVVTIPFLLCRRPQGCATTGPALHTCMHQTGPESGVIFFFFWTEGSSVPSFQYPHAMLHPSKLARTPSQTRCL